MKLWVYRVLFLAFALIIIYLTLWVSVPSLGGVHFQIDASNVSGNNTLIIGSVPSNITVMIIDGNVVFAKVGLQNIPTLINGITTSTSIIVAFSGGIIAYMLRELFPNDRKAKIAFFGVSISFIYIFSYLFWVYILLATGLVDTALRWSLDGLLLTMLISIGTILLGYYRLDSQREKKSDKPDSEPDKTEIAETEVSESKPIENKETDNKDYVKPPNKSVILEGEQTNNIKIALKANAKPRSRFGYVVGSVIEFSFEVSNIDSRPFSGGILAIIITPANGIFVRFTYPVKSLQPNEKMVIDKNSNGDPLTTNVLASGFTLFSAQMNNVDIYSPPTEYRDPRTSFYSILGKSKEEIYTLFGLIMAAIGLFLTAIIGIIQLLH